MKIKKIIPLFLFFTFAFTLSSFANAKNSFSKKGHSKTSIAEAMEKSNQEQRMIKQDMYDRANQRFDKWSERGDAAIQIQHGGSSSLPSLDLGDPSFSLDESGEDHSGLDSLRGEFEQESTDIDFDAELREVSSTSGES